MKNWLVTFCIMVLLGVHVGAVKAEQSAFYIVRQGDTLLSRFGPRAAMPVCQLNKLPNCNRIFVGQALRLPDNVRGRDDMMVYRNVATMQARIAPAVRQQGQACITLGAAPFNPEHSLARTLQGIDLLTTLSPEQKALAKKKVGVGERTTKDELVGHQVFKEMLYQSHSRRRGVVHIYDKRICSPEQGGRPEVMDTYYLGKGVFLSTPRRCGNVSVFAKPLVLPQPVPPPAVISYEPQPEPLVVVAPSPEPSAVTPKEVLRRWDWELVVGQEHERTSHSTFVSGAVYPLIVDGQGAEHAFGLGGTYSAWHGRTDTDFSFRGDLKGFGPAYKYSAYEGGYDLGVKILPWGSLTENGFSGDYKSQRKFDLRGITLSYNNYEREMRGEKSFFKYQLFLSAFKPTGHSEVGHTWEGKPISDTSELSKLDHVVNVGARVGLYDFSQEDEKAGLKLWGSVGWFQEAPSLAETADWRIQLSDKQERLFFGIGRNYDLLHGGSLLGYGWSWDIRKTVYVHREEVRHAQFVAAIERAGGSLDKDGMVRLPERLLKPQSKRYIIAPSDD